MIDSVTESFFSLAFQKIEATLQECIINMATLLKWLISNFFSILWVYLIEYYNKSTFSCVSCNIKIF